MNAVAATRLDRSAFQIASLDEDPKGHNYWRTKSPGEVEYLVDRPHLGAPYSPSKGILTMPTKRKSSSEEIYQIKVTLLGTDPPIWRRLLLPADLTLALLHDALQSAMGWENSHLHEFRVGGQSYGEPDPNEGAFGIDDRIDERKVRLYQVLGRVGSKAVYTYDFGDGWEHGIVLEKRLPADPDLAYPACTGGQGACPPEDCGGIPGFYDLLEAIRNPEHERREELLDWVGEEYDPEAFSMETVNRALHGRRRRLLA